MWAEVVAGEAVEVGDEGVECDSDCTYACAHYGAAAAVGRSPGCLRTAGRFLLSTRIIGGKGEGCKRVLGCFSMPLAGLGSNTQAPDQATGIKARRVASA